MTVRDVVCLGCRKRMRFVVCEGAHPTAHDAVCWDCVLFVLLPMQEAA